MVFTIADSANRPAIGLKEHARKEEVVHSSGYSHRAGKGGAWTIRVAGIRKSSSGRANGCEIGVPSSAPAGKSTSHPVAQRDQRCRACWWSAQRSPAAHECLW